MSQKEKIQIVFEAVELEKEELRQERDALRQERKAIEQERKDIASFRDTINQAVSSFKKMETIGLSETAKAIKEIEAIRTNTSTVKNESLKAIDAVKRQKIFASFLVYALTVLVAFVVSFAVSYLAQEKYVRNYVLSETLAEIEQKKTDIKNRESNVDAVKMLLAQNVVVYENAIVFPSAFNLARAVTKTEDGRPAIFFALGNQTSEQ